MLGAMVGFLDGDNEGCAVGIFEGDDVGPAGVGWNVGVCDGFVVGNSVGFEEDGDDVG